MSFASSSSDQLVSLGTITVQEQLPVAGALMEVERIAVSFHYDYMFKNTCFEISSCEINYTLVYTKTRINLRLPSYVNFFFNKSFLNLVLTKPLF